MATVSHVDASTLIAGLSPQQEAAVTSKSAPLCIIAGAGSGKTRVLTRRVAWRIFNATSEPEHTLVLTFTRKASTELKGRLRALGVRDRATAGTFHSVAYASLRRRWADAGNIEPTILLDPNRILRAVLGSQYSSNSAAALSLELAGEVSWAKSRDITPKNYEQNAASRDTSMQASEIATHFAAYETEKRKRRVVDFDDLVKMCSQAIEDDPQFAAAQRWRYRHIFVDESQDLNPAQWRLLQAWRGDRNDLCMVGDPYQAIYSWNGAAPELFDEFALRNPGSETLTLDENWRSTPQILDVASVLITHGEKSPINAPFRPPLAKKAEGPFPTLTEYSDELAEASNVSRRIAALRLNGYRWKDIAVLARTNAQLGPIQSELRALGIASQYDDPNSIDGQDQESRSGVTLATFHRSKGLEWDVVFLIGLEDGLAPIWRAVSNATRSEERRLLYVAMTRAARELHCSWASTRESAKNRRSARNLSPFLIPVSGLLQQWTRQLAPRDALQHIAQARSELLD